MPNRPPKGRPPKASPAGARAARPSAKPSAKPGAKPGTRTDSGPGQAAKHGPRREPQRPAAEYRAAPRRRPDDKEDRAPAQRSALRPAGSRKVAEGAIALLDAIDASREPADRVRHRWMRANHARFEAPERDALIHICDEVLRQRGRLDWWIGQGRTALPPDNRLRVAALRILAMGAKTNGLLPLFQAGDAAVEALLRRLEGHTLEHPDMPPAARFSLPAWILPHLKHRFGADLELELAAMLRPAPLDVRINPLKTTRAAAAAALEAEGLRSQATPFSPFGLRLAPNAYANNTAAYAEGLVEPQDEGSQLAAQLVGAAGAKLVVDFCAGAGGKTLVLAAAMKNAGRLVALDVSAARLAQAKLRLRRAGVHNAECRAIEAKWLKRQAGKAERVLVDAPCTGTGTWRRKPDAKWRLVPNDLAELVPRQAEILDRAARLVAPGGRLVYVTCSVLREENDDQVAAFLQRHPDFRVVPVGEVWAATIGGACPVPGPFLSLTPGRQGTDGFFAAVLQRTA